MKKTLSLLTALAMTLSISGTVLADADLNADPQVHFSNTPVHPETILEQKQIQDENATADSKVSAWDTDIQGNKNQTQPAELTPGKKTSNSDYISPMSYYEGSYYYEFVQYKQSQTKTDPYHFFISSVSLENKTVKALPLKYIQADSSTSKWTSTNNLKVDAGFKAAWFAKLEASVNFGLAYEKTTNTSTTIEFTIEVPVGHTGYIEKYNEGAYSGGIGYWKKYNINNLGTPLVGTHEETGNGWVVARNKTNFKVR